MGVPSPRVIARRANARRGNPYSPVIARSASDVAISCGKVSHSSKFEKRCHLAPGDSHGPHGPRNDKKGCPLPCHCEGATRLWQSPAVRFPIHRSSRNAATLPREIPTGLTALGMTEKASPLCVIARRANARRGNPHLLRCDVSRGSQKPQENGFPRASRPSE